MHIIYTNIHTYMHSLANVHTHTCTNTHRMCILYVCMYVSCVLYTRNGKLSLVTLARISCTCMFNAMKLGDRTTYPTQYVHK